MAIIQPTSKEIIFETYIHKRTFMTINDRLVKKLNKIAKKLADEIVSSYDFKQYFRYDLGDKIIITSVLTRKHESKSKY